MSTLRDIPRLRATESPDRPAIMAPGRDDLSWAAFEALVARTIDDLRSWGVGPATRVGLISNDGPEMAAAYMALVSSCVCAPLNPAYQESELETFMADLELELILVEDDLVTPTPRVAERLGIAVAIIQKQPTRAAGSFELRLPQAQRRSIGDRDVPHDKALLLHTSGTTSKAKLVSLTDENLSASAASIARSLELTAADSCLNVMPLFHIHGLVGAALATWQSGGALICPPKFDAIKFAAWAEHFQPTWLSGVPTMHRAIVGIPGIAESLSRRLRFLRSASSRMPPELATRIEALFGVPLIEAYGMTEASHQICTNPLPPGIRKPGSVGIPYGDYKVDILLDDGRSGIPDQDGEILISGPGVTKGYLNNEAANQASFVNGWFRTGDIGHIDQDGYLFITGRIKEMVNRGGEKVAPVEVDEVLMQHPAVFEAATFALPHASLGEDVAAVVVTKPGVTLSAEDLRQFAARHIAEFKVPRQLFFVPKIPKGPTGKLQRSLLTTEFGAKATSEFQAPRTASEVLLADLWQRLLGVERVGVTDNFYSLGGDSLSALSMVLEAEGAGLAIDVGALTIDPTIKGLLERLATEKTLAADLPRTGTVAPIAMQRLMIELEQKGGWKTAVLAGGVARLDLGASIPSSVAEQVTDILVAHHDSLRSRFVNRGDAWDQIIDEKANGNHFMRKPITARDDRDAEAEIASACAELSSQLDARNGTGFRLVHCDRGTKPSSLLLALDHVVGDAYSLRILLEDVRKLCGEHLRGAALVPLRTTHPYIDWARRLHEQSKAQVSDEEMSYWSGVIDRWDRAPVLPRATGRGDLVTGIARVGCARTLTPEHSSRLIKVLARHNLPLFDCLAAAVLLAVADHGASAIRTSVALGGRTARTAGGMDLSRTVGPFAAFLPAVVEVDRSRSLLDLARSLPKTLGETIRREWGYRLLVEQPNTGQRLEELRTRGHVALNLKGNVLASSDTDGFRVRVFARTEWSTGTTSRTFHLAGNFHAKPTVSIDWNYDIESHPESFVESLNDAVIERLTTLIASEK